MSDIAISIRGLGKQYRLGAMPQAYGTLRDSLAGLFKKAVNHGNRGRETFWALRDVSFDVPRGQVLGVIGANGAGKSTLLKILSRVTEPTEGEIRFRGRVSSLLEVGTGFHPELTGRENVYLSGQVLGMDRRDVARKFDEIVAFAGVERFIDTPLKRFSSGMNVRLGFAVAAHLDPEILVVDEVLAVGDAEFQRKCIGRMKDVSQEGRMVIFVSHNMTSIGQLCGRCILLEKGRANFDGDPAAAISRYSRIDIEQSGDTRIEPIADLPAQISRLRVLNQAGEPESVLDWDKDFSISVEVTARERVDATMGLRITNEYGVLICKAYAADSLMRLTTIEPGRSLTFTATFNGGLLNQGLYNCTAMLLQSNQDLLHRATCPAFAIEPLSGQYNYLGRRKANPSVLRPFCRWAEATDEASVVGIAVQKQAR